MYHLYCLRCRYTLPEDIPEGHVTLKSPHAMMPAFDEEGVAATVFDFFFDTKTSR